MTVLPISTGSHLLRNMALGLLIAAGSTFAAVETASAEWADPEEITICPPRYSGDNEFGGNPIDGGIRVRNVRATRDGQAIEASIFFRLHEKTPDHTTASFSEYVRIWSPRYGHVQDVDMPESYNETFNFGRDDHDRKTIRAYNRDSGPVNKVEIVADTKGRDLGNTPCAGPHCTCVGSYARIYFNKMKVTLRE